MASSYPQVEILKFAVSDTYKQDPTVLNAFLDKVITAPGVTGVWHGPEVQDDSFHYVVVKWAYKDDSSAYNGIEHVLIPARKEVVFVHYTRFGDGVAEPALDAPITEFAVLDVKPDVELPRFYEAGDDLLAKLIAGVPHEVIPGGRGSVEGESRKFVVCVGWQSLERFYSEIQARPHLLEAVMTLRGLVDLDLKHAKLARYAKS